MSQLLRPVGLRAGFHAAVDDADSGLLHAGEQWAPAQFLIGRHTHPVWEFYLQMKGVTRWQVGTSGYDLDPGHLLAVAPGVEHCLVDPVHGSHHFYFAAIDLAPVLCRHPGLSARWTALPGAVLRTGAEPLADAFANLMRELTVRQDFPVEGLHLAVDQVVLAATRSLGSASPVSRLATHPAIPVVRDLLDRQYTRRWTLAELADRVGLAPTYLAGLFAADVGQPPHQYLLQRRVDRARQLLRTSDLSVTAIAVSLGFGSGQHFARVFRQVTGCSPTGYRAASGQVTGREGGYPVDQGTGLQVGIDGHGHDAETRLMTIDMWWPQLPSEARDWLMANNGSTVPPAVVQQIALAGGPAISDPWWTKGDDDPSEVLLPDAAVDWVEEIANGESPATP